MRLTSDLIQDSLSYINPLMERELDLRGHKIPAIENLGAAAEQDCIDFTDNDIVQIANFPLNPRLRTLMLARNRVVSIHPRAHESIPNLSTLVLTQNSMGQLADLDPLASFKKLTYLVLLENPVTGREHYRYWVIWRCPSVRFLDYQKVKDPERVRAKELFGTAEEPTQLAQSILGKKSHIGTGPSNGAHVGEKKARLKLTEKQKIEIKEKLKKATTLVEIARLDKMLNEGRFALDVDNEETMDE